MSNKTNKMGIAPIPKLLISMSLPMMISMMVQAFYNIVDSIFVSKINEAALTAVSLAFPIQNLMIAVASGTAVGINALLSRSLGEGNTKKANLAAVNGIFLEFIFYIVFAIFGLLASEWFFALQTSDAEIIRYGKDYMFFITVCSIGVFLQTGFERLLQSTGKTFYTMITQGTGAIINIILDPILIFGLLGFPRMEVAGAALATVIGQIVAMILAIVFNLCVNHDIHIDLKHFKPNPRAIKEILQVGIPSIIMISIGSIMTFGVNKILLMFSSTATAVFGVYYKLNSIIFMPVFGLNNGMIPIIAYNYGARNKKRITDVIKLSSALAVIIMFIGFMVFQIFPAKLLGLFNASDAMLEIGIPALKIISISFPFAGYCIVNGSVFQAMGNGVYSLIISICRQLVVLLPIAYIFAAAFGLQAVWWSYPLAEIVAVVMSSLFLRRIYKLKIKPLGIVNPTSNKIA